VIPVTGDERPAAGHRGTRDKKTSPRRQANDGATTSFLPCDDDSVVRTGAWRRALGGISLAAVVLAAGLAGPAAIRVWRAGRAPFPGLSLDETTRAEERDRYVRAAAVLPGGDLYAAASGIGLARLSRSSDVLWSLRIGVHHDFFVDAHENVYLLTHETRLVPEVRASSEILEEFVTVVSLSGVIVRKVSILRALRRSPWAPLLERAPEEPDILHANSIEALDGRFAGELPLFSKGRYLVSLHRLDAVVLVDPEAESVVWTVSSGFRRQHSASLVPPGRVLLFDNLGSMIRASRILEVDPAALRSRCLWGDGPGDALYSETQGAVQGLPIGNLLIVESNGGRALEVTPDRRIVWEWESPHRTLVDGKELVATLYSVTRVAPEIPFLEREDPGGADRPRAVPAS